MRDDGYTKALPGNTESEPIRLEGTWRTKYRGFVVFLICCGLLLAAFAVTAVWKWEGSGDPDGAGTPNGETSGETSGVSVDNTTLSDALPPSLSIPEGAMPVCSMDLTYPELGEGYLHNETVYTPDVKALLEWDVSCQKNTGEPLVLILHTHTSESYLPSGTNFLTEPVGNLTYSQDASENVLSVGEVLCKTLNENGITAIHCTVMHDTPTLSGAYDRSEATVREYLERYPSIEYVIDLHRDAVINAEGEYIRTATEEGESAAAQVLAVVGTDGNGTEHNNWQGNLALALQLRQKLNEGQSALGRPVSLRNASYHQELAKHSLLLEIGSGGNSVEEAKRAAVIVGEALAELICPEN